MMPRVRVRLILEDAAGNPLSLVPPEQAQQVYALEGDCQTLNQIEAAVERFRQRALPDLEQTLLGCAQEEYLAQEKKRHDPSQRPRKSSDKDAAR